MFDWLINKLFTWGIPALIIAAVILAMNLLAKTGGIVRKGVEIKRSLRAGWKFSAGNEQYNRKATLYIVLPTVLWLGLYTYIFLRYPLETFIIALLFLICPLVGYKGYKFAKGD